jgi:hypothetical protein
METKKTLMAALAQMRSEAGAFEKWIGDEHRTGSGNYNRWGARDLVAHAAEWTLKLESDMQGMEEDKSEESGGHSGDINRELFDRHADSTWEHVVGMLNDGLSKVEEAAAVWTEDRLSDTDAEQGGRPAWWAVAFYAIVHNLTHIGQALIRSGAGNKAVELQERMSPVLLRIGDYEPWKGVIAYNLGRIYLLTGRKDDAVAQVRFAVEQMPAAAQWVQRDEDFEEIRELFQS